MAASQTETPGIFSLLRKLALTGIGALNNRGELFLVEIQEENNRVIETFIWAVAACFLGLLCLGALTAAVIILFPADQRAYAAGGFALLYFIGTVLCLLNLKAIVRCASSPFENSLAEIKKDREWLESLK